MNEKTTNITSSRAEKRRAWKEFKRNNRYKESDFLDFSEYKGFFIKPSKYMPHIGNKQKGVITNV